MSVHRENNCQVPFCNECWAVTKANITGLMDYAARLRSKSRVQANTKPLRKLAP